MVRSEPISITFDFESKNVFAANLIKILQRWRSWSRTKESKLNGQTCLERDSESVDIIESRSSLRFSGCCINTYKLGLPQVLYKEPQIDRVVNKFSLSLTPHLHKIAVNILSLANSFQKCLPLPCFFQCYDERFFWLPLNLPKKNFIILYITLTLHRQCIFRVPYTPSQPQSVLLFWEDLLGLITSSFLYGSATRPSSLYFHQFRFLSLSRQTLNT